MNNICRYLGKIMVFAILLTGCSVQADASAPAETSTATPSPSATSTPSPTPTPEPTPIGGSGRIVLTAPYDMYKETHPELGEGQHLFLLDLATGSLAPLTASTGKYNGITQTSPDGRFLVVVSTDETTVRRILGQNVTIFEDGDLNLLDVYSREIAQVVDGGFAESGCFNLSCFGGYEYRWVSHQTFAFIDMDEDGNNRIYILDPVTKETSPITPEGQSIDRFSVVSPSGPLFWATSSGSYQTTLSGETTELEEYPYAWGKWIIEGMFRVRLKSPEHTAYHSVEDLLNDSLPQNPLVLIRASSPDQSMLLVEVLDLRSRSTLGWFIWHVEGDQLIDLPLEVGSDEGAWQYWLPDGKAILIARAPREAGELVTGETLFQVYSVADATLIHEFPAPGVLPYYDPAFSADGRLALFRHDLSGPMVLNLASFEWRPLSLPESWLAYYAVSAETAYPGILPFVWVP